MVNLTDEQKALFYTGGNFKDYVFYFPDLDLKITNDTIHQEAVTIKESICEDEEFTLGGCIASSIEFEVSEIITHDLTGLEFTATLYVNVKDNGTYDLKLPMGIYRVDSAKMVDDKDYKKVVAYDALYDASIDASDWYNSLLPNENSTVTVKQMRESLLMYLDLPFVRQNLANDNIVITKTVRAELGSLPGMMVLRNLCEIAGGFGRINREGKFEVYHLGQLGLFPEDGLKPSENLYPEETLYPEDNFQYLGTSDGSGSYPEYRTTRYEEYTTEPISCLIIQTDDEDEGVTIGTNIKNPYLLTGNFLLFGKNNSDIQSIGQGIFEKIKGVYYRPNTTELDGLPYLETGDVFALQKRNDILESYILSRTLTGVQGLRDTYEAKGSQVRTNEVSQATELIQLKGKTLKIEKTIDKVSVELKDIEQGTNSKFEQTDEKIIAEINRATAAEGQLNTKVTQTANSITSEVSRATAAEGSLSTRIAQNETQISLKVTAGDVQSLIEQNADSIRMKANKIAWKSKYSEMTEDGILKCSSEEIAGAIMCGRNDGYWLKLNTNGSMTGGYSGSQHGKINFAASSHYLPTGEIYRGLQLTGGILRISADMISVSNTSNEAQITMAGSTGVLTVITKVEYNEDYPGGIYWENRTLSFTNGILTTLL